MGRGCAGVTRLSKPSGPAKDAGGRVTAVIQRHPRRGQLWLSRPPFLFIARILNVVLAGNEVHVSYELLGEDGSRLLGPIDVPLDDSWWDNFQPLEPRFG